MAQKKITDLQLIDAVTSGISVPSDDGIQSYRFTAAQMKAFILANENILLAMLKDDIFSGLSSVTPADDDYFPLIDASDSNKTKKGLVGSFARNVYRAISSLPDTLAASDRTVRPTTTSGTITFPANGTAGKRYTVVHGGTAFTNVYTLATTGGAVFKTPGGDIASGDYKLYTTGERVTFEDDGTNWIEIDHQAKYIWTPTPTVTGFGTVGTTGYKAYRDGKWVQYDFFWTNGTVPGSTLAEIVFGNSLTIDTAYLARGNTSGNAGHLIGRYASTGSANEGAMVTATGTNADRVYFSDNTGSPTNQKPTNSDQLAVSSATSYAVFKIPITQFML